MKKLEGKVAIVTGGAGSIGQTTAKLFLAEGAKVLLVDINERDLTKAVTDLGGKDVNYCVADVSKSSDIQRYVNEPVSTGVQMSVPLLPASMRMLALCGRQRWKPHREKSG